MICSILIKFIVMQISYILFWNITLNNCIKTDPADNLYIFSSASYTRLWINRDKQCISQNDVALSTY